MAKSHPGLVKVILVLVAAMGFEQRDPVFAELLQPSNYCAKLPGTAASIFT